jgi:predicted RNA binding protein YcfA (HicA-like mRNA interferase family)
MKKSNSKEINQMIKNAEKRGWVVIKTKRGHLKWRSPSGNLVFSSSTPSDRKAAKNIAEDLVRYGYPKGN